MGSALSQAAEPDGRKPPDAETEKCGSVDRRGPDASATDTNARDEKPSAILLDQDAEPVAGPSDCVHRAGLDGEAKATRPGCVRPELSKNARKRALREERQREKKMLRKAQHKSDVAARKAIRMAEREAKLASMTPEERIAEEEARRASFRADRAEERQARARVRELLSVGTKFAVCIDLGWTEHMTEKELKSLVKQIGYSYSAIRKVAEDSQVPMRLSVAGLDSSMKEMMDKQASGWTEWPIDVSEKPLCELHAPSSIVYLTHDSDVVLECLDADKVYVIGGIVDRNRLKSATFSKAKELGLATARLNLDTSIHIGHGTPVLTVNHCVEILQHAAHGKSWQDAYVQVLPPRKGLTLRDTEDA